jgi:hypothetical protein
MIDIYFSDYFSISPQIIEDHGAFDISLINDLPLFIDPFLLFNSEDRTYQNLHSEIIRYMRFLKDISLAGKLHPALIKELFTFPEIKQNWFGLSRIGNNGRGLGPNFAKNLHKNLKTVFKDFGSERVTQSSHIEKLCLIGKGVGRDNISDFTTNLILGYLAEYTEEFAINHLQSTQRKRFPLRKISFNYATRSWTTRSFELSYLDGDFILLTPKNLLTKDESWINRTDLIDRFREIAYALPDEVLREQVNEYLRISIPTGPDVKKDAIREAMEIAIQQFPEVVDYYIRYKEDNGHQAVSDAKLKVEEVETIFQHQLRDFVTKYLEPIGFYELIGNTYIEAYKRVMFLKDVIENKGGHRIFYIKGQPIKRESDLQIMFRLTWFGTPSDITREANDGRGPVDFKASRGASDKTNIEFKLATNTQLRKNLAKQCEIYEKASDTTNPSIKVILYFDGDELDKVQKILKELKLEDDKNIVLIDACNYNKPSGSLA